MDYTNWPRSERGYLLPICNYIGLMPVLTVELTDKWYSLHLVRSNGSVEILSFGELEAPAASLGCSPFCDHVPNPAAVRALAESQGWRLDSLAEELIVGRWELEVMS